MAEQTIKAQQVDLPGGACEPLIDCEDGLEAQEAFRRFDGPIQLRLLEKLEIEINDPDIFFEDEADGFPLRAQVSGRFYLGDRFYETEDDEHTMSIMLNCLDHAGEDYVGMEMLVYLSPSQSEPQFEEHFQSSSI